MKTTELLQLAENAQDRFAIWIDFINQNQLSHIAEVGVLRGDFAERILQNCPNIQSYHLIDPWRNLSDWNKPANVNSDIFELFYAETVEKTKFASEKLSFLKGKTTEIIQEVKNESLDFVYVDADHTLKGITIDLINWWPKLKEGGFLAGDDFSPTIWQHDSRFEPSMVFPFAVYFAEAVNAPIYALSMNQFLIEKNAIGFQFTDLSADKVYSNTSLLKQFEKQANKVKSDNYLSKLIGMFSR